MNENTDTGPQLKEIIEKTTGGDSGAVIRDALFHLDAHIGDAGASSPVSFETFLKIMTDQPTRVIRNVFQVFYDMIKTYVGDGVDEYPDDPESINFVYFDCTRLFVEGADQPFFADRIFANRLMTLTEALRRGAQQNKIYIFDGPPGCGKSTFLNNLLKKFEVYANTEAGMRYETVWRLDRGILGGYDDRDIDPYMEKILQSWAQETRPDPSFSKDAGDRCPENDPVRLYDEIETLRVNKEYLEIPCPSHDNPLLMIPKEHRRSFFDDIFANDEFKWKLFTGKEYEWIFRDNPCTVCTSLYEALLSRLKTPKKVYQMLYVRPYRINRRLGEGISVFNPGDRPMRETVLGNPILQRRLNRLLKDSNEVLYVFSRYAKTNNGIYALMDIKSNNTERLIELHNIISEGVHKVEDMEENVDSLFFALMNPEDKQNISGFQSFSDRIEYIKIPYVMDLNTEVSIYRSVFGRHIDDDFLPRVLHNFARTIISSRISTRSAALLEWIGDPQKYRLYCDENLQLLKMEIYTGHIPTWLSEEDRKRFTAKRRRRIIGESETEGMEGLSGRDSIKVFNEFYSHYAKQDRLINMSDLYNFFTKTRADLRDQIPAGILDSIVRMYDYTLLQEVKESLYYYNEEQISRDILNYMFAVNFEIGAVETCHFTAERLEITRTFFESLESRILSADSGLRERRSFRAETQKEYTTKTLPQEILMAGTPVTETDLYRALHQRYVYNLKEKVLDPFLDNENFRQAVKDFGEADFKTYDRRIRDDVSFLIGNLCGKYRYTQQGAREVCIYVIDNNLARKFD